MVSLKTIHAMWNVECNKTAGDMMVCWAEHPQRVSVKVHYFVLVLQTNLFRKGKSSCLGCRELDNQRNIDQSGYPSSA